MDGQTVPILMGLAGGTLAVIGSYVLITTFITGATGTIDMMGYGLGALLIVEGASHFASNYAQLE